MALTSSGTITHTELNTEFNNLETDLKAVVDAWATPDYSLSFTTAAISTGSVDFYFYAPDDAKVLALCVNSYDASSISGTYTATLAPADADDLLNQTETVAESLSYSSENDAKAPTPTNDYSGTASPLWLRKGARYKLTLSGTAGNGTLDYFAATLALRLFPRRV